MDLPGPEQGQPQKVVPLKSATSGCREQPMAHAEEVSVAELSSPHPPLDLACDNVRPASPLSFTKRLPPVPTMASALRPTLLRQALAAPSKRALSTSTLPAFRSQRQIQSVLRPSSLVAQKAAFQTSQQRHILPPLPQVIKGSVNDAAKSPEPSPSHGSLHWSMER